MELRISTPCPMTWDSLKGDDRVRYCGQCRLNVYNLADMPKDEVEALVRRTEGRLCGTLYMRGDRTATVRPCRGAAVRKRIRALVTMSTLLLLGATAWFFRTQVKPDRGSAPPLVRDVLDWIDPPPRPNPPLRALGEICPPAPPGPPPAPPAASPK